MFSRASVRKHTRTKRVAQNKVTRYVSLMTKHLGFDIPTELHAALKILAVRRGVTIKQLVTEQCQALFRDAMKAAAADPIQR